MKKLIMMSMLIGYASLYARVARSYDTSTKRGREELKEAQAFRNQQVQRTGQLINKIEKSLKQIEQDIESLRGLQQYYNPRNITARLKEINEVWSIVIEPDYSE